MSAMIFIKDHVIGKSEPCFIIAEVSQAHDGSLGFAHSFIDAVADAGADAIKFQTHIAHAESTKDEEFRINFSYEDKTRFDYWRRMEFTAEQWEGLYRHALERNLMFLSSAFSGEAVELLDKLGIPAWKVGSGETGNSLLLSKMAQTGKPILLSTGMSGWDEITETIQIIQNQGNPLAVFQCTSKYPNSFDEVGLNVLNELRKRFEVPVGLSDHSGSVYPVLAAMAVEANLVEVHVTFHRAMFGPDVPASVTLEELKFLTQARDAFYRMERNPVDKNKMASELSPMRSLFNKSVALKNDMIKGTVLQDDMLTGKKPGSGIPVTEIKQCVGKMLTRDVSANSILRRSDLK
jgi:N,N'-diacetyllegionaminate synthase